jgi:putative phosphoribosyl transferase
MSLPFRDRHDAGRQLGELMYGHAGFASVVLGLPRGGVPVAYQVAHALRAPLDVFLLRHLQVPAVPGRYFGVVASGGVRVLDDRAADELNLAPQVIDEVTHRERLALLARERTYRGHLPLMDLRDRTVLLIDDGSASAATLREAVVAVREHQPARVVLGLPLVSGEAAGLLADAADDLVLVASPPPPVHAERWYMEFLPVSHTEVRALLHLAQAEAQSRELAASVR